MENNTQLTNDIINYIIDTINEYEGTAVSDLHHNLFNTDYWCIGTYEAEQEIAKHCSVFKAIEIVRDYEIDNFGECGTDLTDAERVVNMLVYILGEEILGNVINAHYDSELTEDIINDLKTALS